MRGLHMSHTGSPGSLRVKGAATEEARIRLYGLGNSGSHTSPGHASAFDTDHLLLCPCFPFLPRPPCPLREKNIRGYKARIHVIFNHVKTERKTFPNINRYAFDHDPHSPVSRLGSLYSYCYSMVF